MVHTLNLDESKPEGDAEMRESRFWRRQFQQASTSAQRKFDWAFGVVIPVTCVLFDPVIFRGNALGVAPLGNYKAFAYLLSFTSILAMTAWLLWGQKLKGAASVLAGLFLFGSGVSIVIGVLILPLSVLGLFVLIGVFGFTPLFSGIVYLRNGVRALRCARDFVPKRTLVYSAGLSALLSFAIPFTVNAEIRKSLDAIKNGDVETVRYQSRKLRMVAPLVNFDVMAKENGSVPDEEQNSPRMQAIGELYFDMTGNRIEDRRWYFD